ncbi:hypothetical protein [Paraburkholderia sp. JPY419]|uniref:hypothetical protein n=1 Tax=Paraburkholderia sp. JPY419 TaxID=667660 RepID=UPI003D192570
MTNKAEVENKIQLPLTDGGKFSPRFIELVLRKAQLLGETHMRPPALALPLLLSALTQLLDNVWQFSGKRRSFARPFDQQADPAWYQALFS